MNDARSELNDKILFLMLGKGIDIQAIKDELYIILDQYEIQPRTTEVALLQQDRNEYLLKKFLISKTVEGRTKRTIEFYGTELRKMFEQMGKTIDDIEADELLQKMPKPHEKDDKISRNAAIVDYAYLICDSPTVLDIGKTVGRIRARTAFLDGCRKRDGNRAYDTLTLYEVAELVDDIIGILEDYDD